MNPNDFEFESVEDGIRFLQSEVRGAYEDSSAKEDGISYSTYWHTAYRVVLDRIQEANNTMQGLIQARIAALSD